MRSALRRVLVALLFTTAIVAGLWRLVESRTFQLFGRVVASVPSTQRRVALTFDDGPVPGPAGELLASLAEAGAHATFFITGAELARHPEIGRALIQSGHELGNHTWSHARMLFRSEAFIRDEIERTDAVIAKAGQQPPILFRPPYGKKLWALPRYLAAHGRTSVTWDVEPDSNADVAQSPERIVASAMARVRPGSIILLHVWYPSRRPSLAAVAPLLAALHRKGYTVVTVSALLADGR